MQGTVLATFLHSIADTHVLVTGMPFSPLITSQIPSQPSRANSNVSLTQLPWPPFSPLQLSPISCHHILTTFFFYSAQHTTLWSL